jgi:radical SAM superfamily enzyme YgiQ (UPF0313 family)
MSNRLEDKRRQRLAAEQGASANPWGGRLSIALVYPNSYHQAMSNLGFQAVYRLLNQRTDTLCERFFLPDPEDLAEYRRQKLPLVSLESGCQLADFDLVAFSISFENDYLNLPFLFEHGRLPLFRAERTERHPLVLCGGVCAFLNPEPLAEIMDFFAVGEAESILDGLLNVLFDGGASGRTALKEQLAGTRGIYLPEFYQVDYQPDGRIAAITSRPPAPPQVTREWLADLDKLPTSSAVLTEATALGDMYLTEVSRGCSRACRFCAAGYSYLPVRERSLETLQNEARVGLRQRDKIGLVGAAVSDYSHIEALNETILECGGKTSLASLRIDALRRSEAEALKASGHKTVALAPEAGSQRMRDLINKGIDEAQVIEAVKLLAEVGIPNLKLYFLIGLPQETLEDIEAIVELALRVRDIWLQAGRQRGQIGQVTLSVNPFIPKPFTPLQWAGMESLKTLKKKVALLRSRLNRQPHLALNVESLRSAQLQSVLARGDRRLATCLPDLAAGEPLAGTLRKIAVTEEFFSQRTRETDEVFPWEVIASGVDKSYLLSEYRQALDGKLSPRCFTGCQRCGICH